MRILLPGYNTKLGNKCIVRLARPLETYKVASCSFIWHKRHWISNTLKAGRQNREINGRKEYVAFYISNYVCLSVYHLCIYVSINHLSNEINCDFLEELRLALQSQSRSLVPIRMCRCLLFLESSEAGRLTNWSEMADRERAGAGQNAVPSC